MFTHFACNKRQNLLTLTTKLREYMQHQLQIQNIPNAIVTKSLICKHKRRHQSSEEKRYILYRDRQTDLYVKREAEFVEESAHFKALPPFVLAVKGLKYIQRNSASVLQCCDAARDTHEILWMYSYGSDASLELLISQYTIPTSFFRRFVKHSSTKTLFSQQHLSLSQDACFAFR